MEIDNELYEIIFKRKSFHLFRNVGDEKISQEELKDIETYFQKIVALYPEIKIKMKIVNDGVTTNRGQEYCILLYSEEKDEYLENIGYIGEQLDLYLVSKNIGTLWFGIGRVEEKEIDDLKYVIMIAIKKIDSPLKFRENMFKSKRKPLEEIWQGEKYLDIANIVRFTPSACNLQPWYVKEDGNILKVYRYRDIKRRGIMPRDKVIFYNQIDMGIFLCFLELCLNYQKMKYQRKLHKEDNILNEKNLIAEYIIK